MTFLSSSLSLFTFKRFTHTTTTTISTTTNSKEPDTQALNAPVPQSNSNLEPALSITAPLPYPNTVTESSTFSFDEEIKDLESLRTAPPTTAASTKVNNPPLDIDTNSNDSPLLEEPVSLNNQPSIASIPDTTAEDIVINETLKKIKVSSAMIGDRFVKRLEERHIVMEETVQATNRFHAIHRRVDEFIRSLGISPRIVYTAAGLAAFYTIYHILRYREIPLGRFFGGLFGGGGSGTSALTTDTITTVSPNIAPIININIPTSSGVSSVAPSASLDGVITAIENFAIRHPIFSAITGGTIIYLLKRKIR